MTIDFKKIMAVIGIDVVAISLFTFHFIKKRAVGKKLPPYLLVGIMIAVHFLNLL